MIPRKFSRKKSFISTHLLVQHWYGHNLNRRRGGETKSGNHFFLVEDTSRERGYFSISYNRAEQKKQGLKNHFPWHIILFSLNYKWICQWCFIKYTGISHFIMFHRCCIFYILKARPSTAKKTMTRFTVIFVLFQWSGTKPTIFPRYACNRFFRMHIKK